MNFRRLTALILSILALVSGSLPVFAQSVDNSLDGLSKQIIHKEIDLIKLNTNFHLNNPTETKFHKWSTAALSTIAYSVADAGNIVTFTNAFKYHTHPENFSVGTAESGPFLIFLGEAIFLGRALGESVVDAVQAKKVKDRGFDQKTFDSRAAQLEGDIKNLLNSRQQLVASSGSSTGAQEQAVLQDIADGASKEFVVNYARGSKLKTYRVTDNIMNLYTSGTGTAGGILIYLAALRTRPRYTGPAGVMFIISGTGFILDKLMAHYISKSAEKKVQAKMLAERNLGPDPVKKLEADREHLASMGNGDQDFMQRLKAYEAMNTCFTKHDAMVANENHEERNKFLHDEIIDATEGGGNIAAGAVIAKAGFSFRNSGDPLVALNNARHFLTRFGTGAIVFTPTATGGIIDTPAEAIYGSVKTKKDCEKKICTAVVLQDRLNLLDQADAAVK